MPDVNNPEAAPVARFDVLVAGAGYVGLATAVAIVQARPSLKVAVVDAAPPEVWRKDGRSSAIAAAACRMLERLGCWAEIEPQAQAMTEKAAAMGLKHMTFFTNRWSLPIATFTNWSPRATSVSPTCASFARWEAMVATVAMAGALTPSMGAAFWATSVHI